VTERGIAAARRVAELARQHSVTPSQLALLWVKDQPAVTAPVIGPRTEAHLDDALPVLEMRLDGELSTAMDEIVPPGSAVADFHNTSSWMKMKLTV
jgi:aryl-alcohol dehydrogenase-like predicted oxidoreductase